MLSYSSLLHLSMLVVSEVYYGAVCTTLIVKGISFEGKNEMGMIPAHHLALWTYLKMRKGVGTIQLTTDESVHNFLRCHLH